MDVGQSAAITPSPTPGAGRAVWSGDAEFSIGARGAGSYLRVSLPPGAQVATVPSSVLAHSANVTAEMRYTTSDTGVLAAAGRALAGAPLLLHTFTAPADAAADLLLAPERLGDLTVIRLDGNMRFCIAGASFLAATSAVHFRPGYGLARAGKLAVGHASGRGLVAIAGAGTIVRVALQKSETYVVRAANLVAWEERLALSAFRRQEPTAGDLKSGAGVASAVHNAWAAVKKGVHLLADASHVRATGPGELYLASRLPPRWSLAESTGANRSVAVGTKLLDDPAAAAAAPSRFAASPFRAVAAEAPAGAGAPPADEAPDVAPPAAQPAPVAAAAPGAEATTMSRFGGAGAAIASSKSRKAE